MINPFKEVQWNPDWGEKRKFARSLLIGFPLVGAGLILLGWVLTGSWRSNYRLGLWIGGGGAAAGLLLRARPSLVLPFYLVWFFLACCVGIVISNLLLSGFYFAVFTPLGVLKRTFGRTQVEKGFDKVSSSYWREVEPVTDVTQYYKQF